MAQGTCELLWLRSFLQKLGFPETKPSILFCDNKSAIMLASDSVIYECTKHIEVDVHFLREKVHFEIISLCFMRSPDQTTDIITKFVGPSLLKSSIVKLGLINAFTPA